jgi:hypothetical protein
MNDIFEKIQLFFKENPQYLGPLFIAFGALLLIGSIKNSKFLLPDTNSWNLKKMDGWVNFFGRGFTRICVGIGGVIVILAGIAWFFAYASM